MGVWIISSLWLLQTTLLWSSMSNYLFLQSFLINTQNRIPGLYDSCTLKIYVFEEHLILFFSGATISYCSQPFVASQHQYNYSHHHAEICEVVPHCSFCLLLFLWVELLILSSSAFGQLFTIFRRCPSLDECEKETW